MQERSDSRLNAVPSRPCRRATCAPCCRKKFAAASVEDTPNAPAPDDPRFCSGSRRIEHRRKVDGRGQYRKLVEDPFVCFARSAPVRRKPGPRDGHVRDLRRTGDPCHREQLGGSRYRASAAARPPPVRPLPTAEQQPGPLVSHHRTLRRAPRKTQPPRSEASTWGSKVARTAAHS